MHQIHTWTLRKSLKIVQGTIVKSILLTELLTAGWGGYPLTPGLQLSGGHLRTAEEVRCTSPGSQVKHLKMDVADFSPG